MGKRRYQPQTDLFLLLFFVGCCCIWTAVQGNGIPMKKLKVGVPIKDSFREFVGVHIDPISNETLVTGFCIDVFNVVVESLPYVGPYEFVPFQNSNGESVDSYNDLVHQVYLQNIFQALKTRQFVLFIAMAVVLFYCEQYMPYLQMKVHDQGDELVLMDVHTLARNGDFVGYQKGSFVKTLLKELNFDEMKLVAYNSLEEYGEGLRKGSKNGGVAAIFDEMPYIQTFINRYCGNYTEVGPIIWTKGFGFVFQKGSPIVHDVSDAILSEKWDKIKDIENKWLGNKRYCHDPRKSILYFIRPPHLTLFWWLFIIVLIVVLFSLVLIMFLYIVRNSAIKLWKRLVDSLRVKREQHTTENDNNNTVVSVNPDLNQSSGTHKFPYGKESKQ